MLIQERRSTERGNGYERPVIGGTFSVDHASHPSVVQEWGEWEQWRSPAKA